MFFVPAPERLRALIANPLERAAAAAAQSIAEVFGMAVSRSGNQLSVNSVDVAVTEACNGLRLVITLFMVCYVTMFIRPYRPWVRILILAATPVVAVIANVARLVPTLYVFGHYRRQFAETFHEVAGAVMVALAFLIVTFFCQLFKWIGFPVLSVLAGSGQVPEAVAPVRARLFSPQRTKWLSTAVAGTALLAAVLHRIGLPQPADARDYHEAVRKVATSVQVTSSEWEGTDIPLPEESLAALRTNVSISRRYRNRIDGRSADLLILQSPDIRDLVSHYPPICYPGQGLTLTATTGVALAWPGTTIEANRYTFAWHDFRHGDATVVDNFMVLPTGQTQPDMNGMERRIGTDRRYYGCAQVQVVYHDAMTDADRTATTESILRPYLPLLRTIESGTAAAEVLKSK